MAERRAEAEQRFEERRRREQERRLDAERRLAEGPRPPEPRRPETPRVTLKPARPEDAGTPDFAGREQTKLVPIPGGPGQWTSRRPEEFTVALDLKTLPVDSLRRPPSAAAPVTASAADLPMRNASEVQPSRALSAGPRPAAVRQPAKQYLNIQLAAAAAIVLSAVVLAVWLTGRRIEERLPAGAPVQTGVAAAQQAYQSGNRAAAVTLALSVPEGDPERIKALELLDTIRRAAEQRAQAARLDAEAAGRTQHIAFVEGLARQREADSLDQPGETLPAATLYDTAATLFRQAAATGTPDAPR